MGFTVGLFVHILGWAQWMASQTALTGLLRREALYADGVRQPLSGQLRALWVALWIGAALTLIGAFSMLGAAPGWGKQGFVHVKFLLVFFELFIAAAPLKRTYRAFGTDAPVQLGGHWFGLTLAGFVAAMALGVFKPF